MNTIRKKLSDLAKFFSRQQEIAARAGLISSALLLIIGVGYAGASPTPMPDVTSQSGLTSQAGRPINTARAITALATYRSGVVLQRSITPKATPIVPPATPARANTKASATAVSTPPAPATATATPPPPPAPTGPPMLAAKTENINPLLLQRFDAFRSFIWKQYGVTIEIRSGYRSTAEQAELYRTLPRGYANPPGTSQHEKGNAIDYTPYKPEFNQHLPMFGLKLPFYPKEQWHVEIVEPH